jgi:mannose-6-phosphate isomerase-like protein (cupin superfamily)
MPETPPEMFHLGRYWDDLVRGETTDASDLDPAMPDVIRHLGDLNRNIVPAPSFLNRIREDLMDASVVTLGHVPRSVDELQDRRLRRAGMARRSSLPKRREPGLWAMTNLATAALLVLTLGSIFVAFSGNQLPALIPAVPNSTEIPAEPGITSEPVFTTTFPSEVLPKTGTVFVDLYLNTLQSDYEETVAPDPDDHGVNASIVLDGFWASKVEGPIRIVHSDGTVEDVPPGVEVTLGPGDTSLQLDTKPGTTSHNPGSTPTRVLGIEVRNPLNSSRFATSGGITSTSMQVYPGDWLTEEAVTVTVRRVTVAPGTVLPPSDGNVWTARYVETGKIHWKLVEAERSGTPQPQFTYPSGKWVPATKAPAGRAIELRSGDDEPAVFLEVTIAPAGAEPRVTSEPVYAVTFPDDATPDDGTYYVDLVVADWQPGVTSSAETRPDDDGPGVWFVMAGKLAVRADGPLRVSRADGSVEEIAPGTEVLLAPGDAALWLKHGWGNSLRSAGDVPVRFLSMGIIERLDTTRFTGAIGTDTSMYPGDWLKEGPVVATVRRVTAAPGTTLRPSDPAGAATLYVEAGTLTWETVAADNVATPLSPLPPRNYDAGSWVSWVNVSPQRKLILSNTGDEPLVYLEVTVAPAGEESPAPGTATPPTVAVDRMVETTIDGLTAGYANVWVERLGIAPGSATLSQGPRPEPQLFAIETGTVVATVASVERTMSAGDFLVRPTGQELVLRNTGSIEAAILFVSFFQVDATVFQYDSTDITEEVLLHYSTYALPTGPIHVVCERLTLPRGTSLPHQPAEMEWLGAGAGQVGVTLEGEDLPTAWDSGEERVFPALAALPVFSPTWQVTLRNAGEEPLVLYRLSVTATIATPTL